MSLKIFKNNIGRICAWLDKFESLLYFLANIRENLLYGKSTYTETEHSIKGWAALVKVWGVKLTTELRTKLGSELASELSKLWTIWLLI